MKKIVSLFIIFLCTMSFAKAQTKVPRFKVIALYENGGHHVEYSKAARVWLDGEAAKKNFTIDYINNTDQIDDAFLAQYQLIIQLDYAPYAWKEKAVNAFQNYITKGIGGWIGFHHATLIGEFDGYPMWQWYYSFLGRVKFKGYIPSFAKATVKVEDRKSPLMKGVSPAFSVDKEEWYTCDQSPRANVHVLATVDESSYAPPSDVKMNGDHPVVWTNPNYKARNVYIFMGHAPELFQNKDYTTLFENAIFWAAAK